jgi:hypothetical protein
VYAASTRERRAWRIAPPRNGWTVTEVVRAAERISREGSRPPLVAFDAPIGMPRSFIDAIGGGTFPAWLRRPSDPSFFLPCRCVADWSLERPFFVVPKGEGSLRAFLGAMHRRGVEPLRRIDELAGAKPIFVAGGIRGAVGCSAIDVWQGLSQCRGRVAIWPFDGSLHSLGSGSKPVVAEIYPRIAYGLAIGRSPVGERVRLSVAKRRLEDRAAFLEALQGADVWMRHLGVALEGVEEAKASEDAFDALVSAVALLRCVLERTPLSDTRFEDAVSEGGILGTGSICLDLPERSFRTGSRHSLPMSRRPRRHSAEAFEYRCPIRPACHVFRGSRGGWDAHVASPSRHPDWHPEVTDPRERRRLFREEFPAFFG